MFGMSGTEMIIIAIVALILIGPDELPKVARTVGKTLREVRKAGDDLRDTFDREVMQEPVKPKAAPPEAIAANQPPRLSAVASAPEATAAQPEPKAATGTSKGAA